MKGGNSISGNEIKKYDKQNIITEFIDIENLTIEKYFYNQDKLLIWYSIYYFSNYNIKNEVCENISDGYNKCLIYDTNSNVSEIRIFNEQMFNPSCSYPSSISDE